MWCLPNMFCPTYAVDVVVYASRTTSRTTSDGVLDYNEWAVRLDRVSPTAKRWSPPVADDTETAESFVVALDWWTRLLSSEGVPVAEWASLGLGENNLRTREMCDVFGIAGWRWSWIPVSFWRLRTFQIELQLATTAERACVLDVVQQRLPAHLKLHPYQEEGVAHVLAHVRLDRRGSIIADEMGLGKTLQALVVVAVLAAERPNLRVLVVCPGFLRFNWATECQKWGVLPSTPQTMKTGKDRPVLVPDEPAIVLASYEWLTTVMQPKTQRGGGGECLAGFDLVVFDEAHMLKTMGGNAAKCSLRNRAAVKLLERTDPPVRHTLFLTGTPAPNYAKELYALLRLTCALDGMSYPEFAFRYCGRWYNSNFCSWDDTRTTATDELHALQVHMLRRLAREHLAALPAEINVFVNLQCPTRELKRLQTRREKLQKALQRADLEDGERARKAAALKNLRSEQLRVCGEGKRGPVGRYLKQYLEDHPHGPPFVVFAYHKFMFESLSQTLDGESVSYAVVNGDTPDAERGVAFAALHAGGLRVLVLSLTMTTGLNLQMCSMCVFAELRWSFAVMRQAMTRIARQGSAFARVKHVWLFGGDVERELYDKLCTKEAGLAETLKRKNGGGGALTLAKRQRK